jgi:uncharacterized iron-regulated membrane protein
LAVISATGIVLQVQVLMENHDAPPPALTGEPHRDAPEEEKPAAAAVRGQPPEEDHDRDLHETIMHIHSGEFFGKFGNVIGLLCGAALFFFSISGLWMYWQMFQARSKNGRREVFW